MGAPVRGLGPARAARLLTLKVPNPPSDTLLFFFSVVFTPPITASSARVAAALEMSACLAMCSISSDLFTKVPPLKGVSQEIWMVVWAADSSGRRQIHYSRATSQCQARKRILCVITSRAGVRTDRNFSLDKATTLGKERVPIKAILQLHDPHRMYLPDRRDRLCAERPNRAAGPSRSRE